MKSESYRTRRLSKTFCIPSQHEKNDKTRYWYYCDEVDKRTAEDIKHRLPCITPSVQLKGNSKKLTDFRKETYWLMPIRRPRISHFRKFCFGDIFLSFGDISVSFGGIFL